MTHQLHPQWIAGFVDGEGCFHVGLATNTCAAFGTQILPEFTVVQHRRDIDVLYALKTYFGCGVVRHNRGDVYAYRVRDIRHLYTKILPFFDTHPLHTQKRLDIAHFARIVRAMIAKEHLDRDGFIRLVAVTQRYRRRNGSVKSTQAIPPSLEGTRA